MGIRKIGITILMTAFAVSLACGCGKKAVDSASVSYSVPESISSVSEEKEPEASVQEPETSDSESEDDELSYEEYEVLRQQRWQKVVENLTLEDLDDAHPNPPEWDGFQEDGSMFFVAAQTEDESATLYCVYDDEYFIDGYMILRVNDRIIPINEMADYGWGIGLFQGDFDNDGEDEYAVIINDGHGTGYYMEKLIVVDSDEKEPVCEIAGEDLQYKGENVYSKIKTEYDESTEELTYWLEDNGSASAKESVSLKGVFEEDEKYQEMLFGDLFSITFEDGQLGFLARGGIITDKRMGDYEYSLVLTGDFNYKDGRITYDNLHLEYEHQK